MAIFVQFGIKLYLASYNEGGLITEMNEKLNLTLKISHHDISRVDNNQTRKAERLCEFTTRSFYSIVLLKEYAKGESLSIILKVWQYH